MDIRDYVEKITTPTFWTVLPPLELRGLASPNVESLLHYILRLAQQSGLTATQLLHSTARRPRADKTFSGYASGICGPGPDHVRRVAVLETLSGNRELRHGTFWVAQHVLASTALTRDARGRRWCPLCYKSWDDETSYEPLSWSVALISVCREHGCDLLDKCHTCGAAQYIMTPLEKRRACKNCHEPLTLGERWEERPAFYTWMERQALELLELCATPGQAPIPKAGLIAFCVELDRQAAQSATASRGLKRSVRTAMGQAFNRRLSLRTLVNLSALQGVSLRQMLLDPREASSRPLLDLWSGFKHLPVPQGFCAPKVHEAARCLRSLKRSIGTGYLPPMGYVLRRLVVLRAVLKEAYPGHYSEYEDRYRREGTNQWHVHASRAFCVALSCIEARRKANGRPHSSSFLVTLVEQRGGVQKALARKVVRSAITFDRVVCTWRLDADRATVSLSEDTEWLRGLAAPQ